MSENFSWGEAKTDKFIPERVRIRVRTPGGVFVSRASFTFPNSSTREIGKYAGPHKFSASPPELNSI
jgi:hypothetical protein